jgi:predicted small secreted protein
LKRAILLVLGVVLSACATIIGVSSDVVDVGLDGATDAADEPDAFDAGATE